MTEVPQRFRRWRWADERPEADQTLVDPTIRLDDAHPRRGWALPAGWVSAVNTLHARLVTVVPGYRVIQAAQTRDRLRYLIDVLDRDAEALIAESAALTATMCAVCGAEVVERSSTPRCAAHPRREVPHAMARPPGWAPT